MQKEIDPKLVVGVIVALVVVVAVAMFAHFSTPANFSGPRVQIRPPKGFAIPTVGGGLPPRGAGSGAGMGGGGGR